MTRLRKATSVDKDLIFKWRNDPWIVSLSSGQQTVMEDEHAAWFESTLNDDHSILNIIEDDSRTPMGTTRVSKEGQSCVITVYLMKEFTGKGYGVDALKLMAREVFDSNFAATILAHIRQDNPVSRSAFIKAGYKKEEDNSEYCPEGHDEFVLTARSCESI